MEERVSRGSEPLPCLCLWASASAAVLPEMPSFFQWSPPTPPLLKRLGSRLILSQEAVPRASAAHHSHPRDAASYALSRETEMRVPRNPIPHATLFYSFFSKISFYSFFFAVPTACGNSQARD